MSDDNDALARGTGADSRAARRRKKRWAKTAERGPIDGFDDFAPLNDALSDLLGAVEPGELGKLTRAIATDLRNANAKRIKANVTPDGQPMPPRKLSERGTVRAKRVRDKIARVRRSEKVERMFQRAVDPQYLRKFSSVGEAQVGFVGAMARIMRVHQYGLRDRVARTAGAPEVTYPVRTVIGLTAEDQQRVLGKVSDAVLSD